MAEIEIIESESEHRCSFLKKINGRVVVAHELYVHFYVCVDERLYELSYYLDDSGVFRMYENALRKLFSAEVDDFVKRLTNSLHLNDYIFDEAQHEIKKFLVKHHVYRPLIDSFVNNP
jgi:hypothetical protein